RAELCQKRVAHTRVRQQSAAKVDRAVEHPGDRGPTLRVDGDRADLDAVADPLAKEVARTAIQLRQKDGWLGPRPLEWSTAEVDGAHEAPRDDHVARAVDGDERIKPAPVAERPAPEVIA